MSSRPDPEALENDLRAFLRDDMGVPEEEISREAELVTGGLVDSMNLVRLATHLERTLGIEVPDADISVDHFDSIEKIVAYVESRLAK